MKIWVTRYNLGSMLFFFYFFYEVWFLSQRQGGLVESLINLRRKLVANYAISVKAPGTFSTFAVVYITMSLFS